MQNKNILWGVGGLIVGGIIIALCFMCYKGDDRTEKGMQDMSMSEMMIHMNANLKDKTSDAFDQAFVEDMIVHHQGAIDMANLALTNAKHPEIKTLAQAIITAQTKEIEQMKVWYKAWYGVEVPITSGSGSGSMHH